MSNEPPTRRASDTPRFIEESSYLRIINETKQKAEKQKAEQLKEAEHLMGKNSPKSRRRGQILVKSAENIEKEAMEDFHSTLNAHLTQQAELCCYGNTSSSGKSPVSLNIAFEKTMHETSVACFSKGR